MIMIDIDDTLIDYTGAERTASHEFGNIYSSDIPGYNSSTFQDKWNKTVEKYYQQFLEGKISYVEQRRKRIRDIFQNDDIGDAETDEIFSVYRDIYEMNWRLFDDVLPFLEQYKNEGFIAISDGKQT